MVVLAIPVERPEDGRAALPLRRWRLADPSNQTRASSRFEAACRSAWRAVWD